MVPALRDDEPDWPLLITDGLEIQAARQHWHVITDELQLAGRWTPANAHAVKRLVLARLAYDRAARIVAETGPIVPSPKTGVPQYSLHYVAMNAAADQALQLEGELLLSPRKRGKAPMKSAKPATRADGMTL